MYFQLLSEAPYFFNPTGVEPKKLLGISKRVKEITTQRLKLPPTFG